jgi:hypothetical protein
LVNLILCFFGVGGAGDGSRDAPSIKSLTSSPDSSKASKNFSDGKLLNLPVEEREFLEESGEEVEDLMDAASREPSPAPPTPNKQRIKLTKEIKDQLFQEFKEQLEAEKQGDGGMVEEAPRPIF